MDEKINIRFEKLKEPAKEVADTLNRWENNPATVPMIRPNKNSEDLARQSPVTVENLAGRMKNHEIFLIYLDENLVGEMNYMIDPGHLFKKEKGTAWIGIDIGEESARGKGVGHLALQYLEEQIRLAGLIRIELGVFEFNMNAVKLYQKLGYRELARIPEFTYWRDKMWADIRMEKYIQNALSD